MTETEFLLDTLQYYTGGQNRRCVNEHGGCYYSPSKSKNKDTTEGCAIGRHLSPEVQKEYDSGYKASTTKISDVFEVSKHKSKAPEWMQNMNMGLLTDVQGLHDNSINWVKGYEHQLTERGKDVVKEIIKKYQLDRELFNKYLN